MLKPLYSVPRCAMQQLFENFLKNIACFIYIINYTQRKKEVRTKSYLFQSVLISLSLNKQNNGNEYFTGNINNPSVTVKRECNLF